MLPLDDIKAPQGKTLELGQSQPAKRRGKKGWGSSPVAGLEDPCPDLNLEGTPTLAQRGEEKARAAWGGPVPNPQGGQRTC